MPPRHRPNAAHDAAIDTGEGEPRAPFAPAVQLSAAARVVAHNHPSGDPTLSAEDRAVTERLEKAAELLGIRFLDHFVPRQSVPLVR